MATITSDELETNTVTMDISACHLCHKPVIHTNHSKPSHADQNERRTMFCQILHRLRPSRAFLSIVLVLAILSQASATDRTFKIPLKRLNQRVNEAVLESQGAVREARSKSGSSQSLPSPPPSERDNLMGRPGEGYYLDMTIGTPPQQLSFLVDTGSSNFAVAAAPHPDIDLYFHKSQSSTYSDLGTTVSVPYTQGKWQGSLGHDLVTLTSMDNSTIGLDIALITHSEDFFINGSQWQGILGLAYAEIARPDSSVLPYFDALTQQTAIRPIFSIQLCSTVDTGAEHYISMGGSLVLGGLDQTLYQGDMVYALIYKEWYYEVVVTDMSVNGISAQLDCKEYNFDKTIVDSGTTNMRLPNKAFAAVLALIQNQTKLMDQPIPALFWTGEQLLCWKEGHTPWFAFPSIEISLAATPNTSVTLTISPQQYLRTVISQDFETMAEFDEDSDCYKFAIAPSDTGAVLGAVVMEAFYVVFDQENKRVGFAQSTCFLRNPDAIQPKVSDSHKLEDTLDCAYVKPDSEPGALVVVAYVMAGICGLCLLPLAYLVIHWQVSRCRQRRQDNATPSDIGELLKEGETSTDNR